MREASPGKNGRKGVPADQAHLGDEEFDVVVVGAGGFSSALNCNRLGSSVVVLENGGRRHGEEAAGVVLDPSNSLARSRPSGS